MATVSVIWDEGGRLRAAAVSAAGAALGRSVRDGIAIGHPTVSREHARIRLEGEAFRLENSSETNPARVRGEVVSGTQELADGDSIQLGDVRLLFSDLRDAQRLSPPKCSHCGRENDPTATHCWYCGTSLVGAPSIARTRQRIAFRAAALEPMTAVDAYPGQAVALGESGPEIAPREGAEGVKAILEADDGAVRLRGELSGIAVNGEAAADGQELADGDEVAWAGRRVVILKPDPP